MSAGRAVYKYEVPIDDQWHEVATTLPARVVHVASQHGSVMLWAEVTRESPDVSTRKMKVFGTGQPIPDGAVYVGTALDGSFVWHVYAEPAA